MRRLATLTAMFAVALPGAAMADVPPCQGMPTLQFDVNKDGHQRYINLKFNERGYQGSPVRPVQFYVIRNGKTRRIAWYDYTNEQYHYRYRRGVARFVAIYTENSSGYGAVIFTPGEPIKLDIPLLFQQPPFNLPSVVLIPTFTTSGGQYQRRVCSRVISKAVR